MAYDSVRAQLDQLLGADRNGPLNASATEPATHFTADSICKHYLLGFCPHDLHIKHRSEPGSCRLKHCDKARADFLREDAKKTVPQKAAWTRALLAECRAIVQDEDRKIRANARRLQMSYGETGNLTGLMIRSFDTLKKLGMVREDAQIRVLSEVQQSDDEANDEDFYHQSGDNTSFHPREKNKAAQPKAPSAKQEKSAYHSPSKPGTDSEDDNDLDGFGVIQVIPSKSEQNAKDKGSTKSSESDPENDGSIDEEDDDDDDLDGFGIIQVIPASKNDKESEKPSQPTDENSHVDDVLDNPKSQSPGKSLSKPSDDKEHDAPQKIHVPSHPPAEQKASKESESKERLETANSDTLHENNEAEKNNAPDAQPVEDKMEEFYKTGKGPDGLLMLDRKRGLRVCACCGGYISLVDAESRLLSHYGGKSHHSLALLRTKVTELEKQVASQPEPASEYSSRYLDHARHNGREPRWQHRDDRRQRGWDRQDRFGGNRRKEQDGRGHGTAGWYHNSGERRNYDNRSGSRWEDDRQRRNGGRHDGRNEGRYDNGRKRFRSPSPHRRNRRSRGYY